MVQGVEVILIRNSLFFDVSFLMNNKLTSNTVLGVDMVNRVKKSSLTFAPAPAPSPRGANRL